MISLGARLYFYLDDSRRHRRCVDREKVCSVPRLWSVAAALLSAFGIIHAYDLSAGGITSRFGLMAAPEFFVAYLLLAVLFFADRLDRQA